MWKRTNWKDVAEKAAARADALDAENAGLRLSRGKWMAVASEHSVSARKHERSGKALRKDLDARLAQLEAIAACETPAANATVRRMARIARGEQAS